MSVLLNDVSPSAARGRDIRNNYGVHLKNVLDIKALRLGTLFSCNVKFNSTQTWRRNGLTGLTSSVGAIAVGLEARIAVGVKLMSRVRGAGGPSEPESHELELPVVTCSSAVFTSHIPFSIFALCTGSENNRSNREAGEKPGTKKVCCLGYLVKHNTMLK